MQLKTITEFDQFLNLKEDWDKLLEDKRSSSLAITHEWFGAWWKSFGTNLRLNIFCIYEGSRLIAIAPFMKKQSSYRRISASFLQLITNGHSPYCDIITGSGITTEQQSQILTLLIEENSEDILRFTGLPENSHTYTCLSTLNQKLKYRHGIKPSLNTPVIRIENGWDEYIRTRSKKFRKGLNNKLNRFKKEKDFKIERITITSRSNTALNEMVEISKKSWKTHINNDLGSKPRGLEFLLQLVDVFAHRECVYLWIFRKNKIPVAYEFHLVHNDTVYPLRADYDENYKEFSPGSILEYTALKTLFEENSVHLYYSCADNYWYLSNWSNDISNHFNVEIFPNRWKSIALYTLEYIIIPLLRPIKHKMKSGDLKTYYTKSLQKLTASLYKGDIKMFTYAVNTIKRGAMKSYHSLSYTPTDAIIFLTYRCTSRCKACNIWQRPVKIEDELTWEQWKPILEQLAKNNIKSIEMFGGDALLRKDLLLKMIRFCTDHGIETYFPTNSSSLTRKTIQDLVDAGLGTIYFSLDEVPQIAESIRGIKRHYDRTTKSIEQFKQARGSQKNPAISCITTVSSLNYKHLKTLINTSYLAGADSHIIRGISEFTTDSVNRSVVNGIAPSPYFMPTDNKSHAFNESQAEALLKDLKDIWNNRHRYHPMGIDMTNFRGLKADNLTGLTYPDQDCVFATTQVVISPYGNVLPCLYYKNYHLGNLSKDDLSNVWGNNKHRSFCKYQQKNDISLCDHCSIKSYHKPLLPTLKDLASSAFQRITNNVSPGN